VFHRWSVVAIDSVGIPRINFNRNGWFAHCVQENMERYKFHEKVTSDLEPFIVPGLSDKIELITSQLLVFGRQSHGKDQQIENKKTQIKDTNLLPHYRNNHNNHRFFWFWTSKTGPKPNRNRLI